MGHYKWEIYFIIQKVKNMTPILVYLGRYSVNVTRNVRKIEVFKIFTSYGMFAGSISKICLTSLQSIALSARVPGVVDSTSTPG